MKKIALVVAGLFVLGSILFVSFANNASTVLTNKIPNEIVQHDLAVNDFFIFENNTSIVPKATIRNIVSSNNGYYIFGNIENSILIARFTFQNKPIWVKTYSSKNKISLTNLTEHNGFLIRGIEFTSTYKDNTVLFQVDQDGNILWNEILGTDTKREQVYQALPINNGYLMVGMIDKNLWLFRIDNQGNKSWEREIEYSKNDMYYYAIKEQNQYVIYSTNTVNKPNIIKVTVDQNGNLTKEEVSEIPAPVQKEHDHYSFHRKVLNQKNYRIDKNDKMYFIHKLSAQQVEWTYEIPFEEILSSRSDVKLLEISDEGCIIQHVFREAPRHLTTKLIKLDRYGNKQWEKPFFDTTIDNGLEIQKGQFVFTGEKSKSDMSMQETGNSVIVRTSKPTIQAVLIPVQDETP